MSPLSTIAAAWSTRRCCPRHSSAAIDASFRQVSIEASMMSRVTLMLRLLMFRQASLDAARQRLSLARMPHATPAGDTLPPAIFLPIISASFALSLPSSWPALLAFSCLCCHVSHITGCAAAALRSAAAKATDARYCSSLRRLPSSALLICCCRGADKATLLPAARPLHFRRRPLPLRVATATLPAHDVVDFWQALLRCRRHSALCRTRSTILPLANIADGLLSPGLPYNALRASKQAARP